MLAVGDTVGDFVLKDQAEGDVRWSDLRGSPVVVFFYPKANTPGCTKEAVGFQRLGDAFAELGVKVVGASADTVKRQAGFADKHELQMPLLADPEHTILEPWGVWGEKKSYGRTSMGIIRSTVLFDADGTVVHVWSPVRGAEAHPDAVLEKAKELYG